MDEKPTIGHNTDECYCVVPPDSAEARARYLRTGRQPRHERECREIRQLTWLRDRFGLGSKTSKARA
jgi:hypothetical protein